MSESAPRPREFQPVESANERQKLIQEATKSVASALIWTRHQKLSFNSYLVAIDNLREEIVVKAPPGIDAKGLLAALTELDDFDCFFSISLTRTIIFFKCKYEGPGDKGLRFAFPHDIYRVQRRRDLRLPIAEGTRMDVHLPETAASEKIVKRRVLDISASGMAVLLAPGDETAFARGNAIMELSFDLLGRKISCGAEVRYLRPEGRPGSGLPTGMRMGIQFQNLRAGDQQAIAAYVFEQSRRFYSKFIE